MTKQYILIRAVFLIVGSATMGFSQSDTLVLNQAEFRFPETHPGEVFLVKKVVISPKGFLGKNSAAEASLDQAALTTQSLTNSPLANRDLRGRSVQGGEYQKRMAQIQQKHGLPTMSARVQEPGKAFKVPQKFQMSEGSRLGLTSNSMRIQSGRDLAVMEKAERMAVHRKYGALSPEFSQLVEAMRDQEEIDISIELALQSPGYLNGMKATVEEQIANARAWANAKPALVGEDLVRRYQLTRLESRTGHSGDGRILEVKASREQIQSLARLSGIVSIVKKPVLGIASVPGPGLISYQTLVNSGYNPPGDMTTYGGSGVATIESGLPREYVNCVPLNLKPEAYDTTPGDWTFSFHSVGMYHLMALASPNSPHYHFAKGIFSDIPDSLINYNIRNVSTSYTHNWIGETDQDSRFVDHLSYVFPYTNVSLAGGNGRVSDWENSNGYDSVPISRTYNSLIVGNIQHYDQLYYTLDTKLGYLEYPAPPSTFIWSATKNPPAKYGDQDDWELPSLVTPGFRSDPWNGYSDSCFTTPGHWAPSHGTSLSAPVTAGIAANVFEALSGYAGPEKTLETRAALMLTAQNADDTYWNPGDHDSKDGAGTISGANAVKFAEGVTRVYPDDDPYENGISSGYFDSATIELSTALSFNYRTPTELPEGKHLRVVLTWTSSPELGSSGENEISDMGLDVSINGGWLTSDTWNSNVEIVDVPFESLYSSANYEILIYPTVYRQPEQGPNLFYYTVAWTWVKNHADD